MKNAGFRVWKSYTSGYQLPFGFYIADYLRGRASECLQQPGDLVPYSYSAAVFIAAIVIDPPWRSTTMLLD